MCRNLVIIRKGKFYKQILDCAKSSLDKVFLVSYILKFRTDKSDANRKREFISLLKSAGV